MEVSLSVVLTEEEGELFDQAAVVAGAQNCQHLYGSVSLSLALNSVGSEDAVCTKAAVSPVWNVDNDNSQITQGHFLFRTSININIFIRASANHDTLEAT